jgi:hypothetical protein
VQELWQFCILEQILWHHVVGCQKLSAHTASCSQRESSHHQVGLDVNGVRLNPAQNCPDFAGHAKWVCHALGLVLRQFDALKPVHHHFNTIVFFDSWPNTLIVGSDNDVNLVTVSNQTTGQALCEACGAIYVGCKSVAGDHNL